MRPRFGRAILPGYRLDRADMLLSFGADFLETWLSPVEYARKFKSMHAIANGRKNTFIHISPYLSLTGANADQWLACRPGSEPMLALALIHECLSHGLGGKLPAPFRNALMTLAKSFTADKVAGLTDIPKNRIVRTARLLMTARSPLVLPGPTAVQGPASAAADLTSVLLNAVLDPSFALYDFDQRHRVEIAQSRAVVARTLENSSGRGLDLLLLNRVNPAYTTPGLASGSGALAGSKFTVVFGSVMDETADRADLVIPTQHWLQTWDAYESRQAMLGTLQPTLGKISDAPSVGDLFMQLLPGHARPAPDYRHYLVRRIAQAQKVQTEKEWLELIQGGGRFVADKASSEAPARLAPATVDVLKELLRDNPPGDPNQPILHVTASLRFYDGRDANHAWLAEMPEALAQVAWQTVALLPASKMKAKGWTDGTQVRLKTDHGELTVPIVGIEGMHPAAVVVPVGQGHTRHGRYARNQGANPMVLLGESLLYTAPLKDVAVTGTVVKLAVTSGSSDQHRRKIALSIPLEEARKARTITNGLTMEDFPLTLPLPEGYSHKRDIYEAHEHDGYRWGMVVDLDRCIGCSACVAACYAENNVGVVGEERVVQGREMAWLRIERYTDQLDPSRLIFLPMMCQHCDNAPCESVCPVYAPHHSKEGLNNQIYNRCIGTRFCAQNCPYKVRRFNWFDWQWPHPLELQLNPNVTVRSKGVMEKCSFCVQRIKVAHDQAKNEKRAIRDGEIIPACAQTCPTDAIVFGNLMDPKSAVRKMVDDPRAYQVMGYLNTKPAVIYLRKVLKTL